MKNEIAFEVKPGSSLYHDYFAYLEDQKKLIEAYDKVQKEFGIESTRFLPMKESLAIEPTEKDKMNFAQYIKISGDLAGQEFKKTSPMNKRWKELVKDIEHFRKPGLIFYVHSLGHRWRERLFHVDLNWEEVEQPKLYGTIESEAEDIAVPDWGIEIKMSEIYAIMEKLENKQ